MMVTVLQLMMSLTILVFIHELGHFIVARLFKCRVERFYLFFNPWFSLFKYRSKKSGTIYGLGWLPLGGYCAISGMVDEKLLETGEKSEPNSYDFRSKPAWQRLLIMIAGIVMNFLLAMLIYIGIAFHYGGASLPSQDASMGFQFTDIAKNIGFEDGDIIVSINDNQNVNVLSSDFFTKLVTANKVIVKRNTGIHTINIPSDFMSKVSKNKKPFASLRIPMVIDSVLPSSSAKGLLLPNDFVTGINGVDSLSYTDISIQLAQNKGQDVSLIISRNNKKDIVTIPIDDSGKIGVYVRPINKVYNIQHLNYNLYESIKVGISNGISTLSSYIKSLKLIFTKEGVQELGGLGSMGMLFSGGFDWYQFWSRTALLSIVFAVMNFLPIPALDGGHIIFLIIEMVIGKSINPKLLIRLQQAGMIFLLFLMLYANLNDVYRFVLK